MASKTRVSEAISTLYHAHPDWEVSQIVTTAYQQCNVVKGDFTDGFCPYKVLAKLSFTRDFEESLIADFSDLPSSVMIANAVDLALPRLRATYPDLSEMELLKIAYLLAQRVISTMDFVAVPEEAFYFAIQIPNEELAQFEANLKEGMYYLAENDFTDDREDPFFAPETNVTSTNVAEIGYDRGKLRIFFQNGSGYEYPVPSSFYMQMLTAPSKGQFVWDELRGRTPGRVIDNPSKLTPGGVGGSIVPYFKVKNASMSQTALAGSVKTFLKAARKGKAEVSGYPIQQIDKPTYKAWKTFLKEYEASPMDKIKRFFNRFKKRPNPVPAQAPTQAVGPAVPNAPTVNMPQPQAKPNQASPSPKPSPKKTSKPSPKKTPTSTQKSSPKKSSQKPTKTPTKSPQSSKKKTTFTKVKAKKRRIVQSKKPTTNIQSRIQGQLRAKQSYGVRGKESKYEAEEKTEESKTEQRQDLQDQLKKIKLKLKQAIASKNEAQIKSYRAQILKIQKELQSLSDFMITDDFMNDMRYFRGPITRAGAFEYGLDVKYKDLDNLKEVSQRYKHLPTFDSHGEHAMIGFAYNFTDDPDQYMKDHPDYTNLVGKPYIYSEGYVFDDIENMAEIEIDANTTKLPVSIRFADANELTG